MPSVKPLRLQREIYQASPKVNSLEIAHAWVDSGLSHLDGPYSYRIPDDLVNALSVGSRIKVPFNSRMCEAIVINIERVHEVSRDLKVVASLLGDIPVMNEKLISFYSQMARYWASDPYSIIRSGVPTRAVSVEKNFNIKAFTPERNGVFSRKKVDKSFLMHRAHESAYVELGELAFSKLKRGSVLLLLPDAKDVARMCEELGRRSVDIPIVRLDSSLSRTERYENYLKIAVSEKSLVVGTRSALFAPINNLDSIIIGFEKSEQFFEQKHPFWNVRDSSILRAEIEQCNIYFTGYVPSSCMALMIEEREVNFVGDRTGIKTSAFPQDKGELLPNRLIPVIRKSLDQGRILFLAPRKGYANALLCAKCKNISLCQCGGRLLITSLNSDPICAICSTTVKAWSCKWCSGTIKYASARGIERFYEEIGRAFPNMAMQMSNAPKILEEVLPQTRIVIATPGSIPGNTVDYSAVVILEGQRFLSNGSTSYEEMVYESFFDAASRVRKGGNVLVVLDSFHPVIASLSRWNPSFLIKKILRESSEAFLPPFSSTAILRSEISEGVMIRNGIAKSVKDGRLPEFSRVYLSQGTSKNESRIFVSVPRSDRQVLVDFLRELSRKRAIAKKSSISIALDPFVLLP
jgi:primosomal protein N' (replication factor Y)